MGNGKKKREQFSLAFKRLPPPVPCYANGACCPWCGGLTQTVTFASVNICDECGKSFVFGYPDWHHTKDPVSWVPFPWKEFEAVGERADMIPLWEPNDRLKSIYFQETEDRIGLRAEENGTH